MQLSGRTLGLCLIGSVVAVAVGFGCGFLTGRHFPIRHYEKFGATSYLLDPSTGKVCDPIFKATAPSVYEQQGVAPGSFPAPPPGFTIVPIKDTYPPSCGE